VAVVVALLESPEVAEPAVIAGGADSSERQFLEVVTPNRERIALTGKVQVVVSDFTFPQVLKEPDRKDVFLRSLTAPAAEVLTTGAGP
jgi:hypothetical protein